MSTSFDFDVPNKMFCALGECEGDPVESQKAVVDPWFLVHHLAHDETAAPAMPPATRVPCCGVADADEVSDNKENSATGELGPIMSSIRPQGTQTAARQTVNKKRSLATETTVVGSSKRLKTATAPAVATETTVAASNKRPKPATAPALATQRSLGVEPAVAASNKRPKPTAGVLATPSSFARPLVEAPASKRAKPAPLPAGRLAHASKKSELQKASDDSEIARLLREHNHKHAPKPSYVPQMHGVKDVRAWEISSGKSWQQLSPSGKDKANAEISSIKSQRVL